MLQGHSVLMQTRGAFQISCSPVVMTVSFMGSRWVCRGKKGRSTSDTSPRYTLDVLGGGCEARKGSAEGSADKWGMYDFAML